MAFILASLFVCSLASDKQTNKRAITVWTCKLPTLGHLSCTSHAENSRFYVKKNGKEKNYAKHKNPKNKKVVSGMAWVSVAIAFGGQSWKDDNATQMPS